MVPEVPADARQVMDDGYAHAAEMVGVPDAREHEKVGRADGPPAEDNLVSVDGERLAPALDHHADGPAAVEDDLVDQAVRPDGQVQAVPRLGEVPDGSAPPDAVEGVEGERADSRGVGVVVVGAVGVSGVPGGVVEGLLVVVPLVGREPPGDDGAVVAVEIVMHVQVILDPSKVGEQVPVPPLVVARRGPSVVVLRHAAQEYHGIHRAGAADDPAPGRQHRFGLVGGLAHVVPAELAVRAEGPRPDVPVAAVAQPDLVGQLLDLGVVRPGFQQQDRPARVLGEPGCDYRSGRPGPDDDGVVVHPDSSIKGRFPGRVIPIRRDAAI